MRAVVAQAPGGPEVLEIVEIDPPLAENDEVEIRVRAFGVNKAEAYYRSGNFGEFVPNQALGIEAVGEIIRDPKGQLAPGQRVAAVVGGMMFARHGGYAEQIAVPRSNVIPIVVNLPDEKLAALPEAYLTVWGALDKNMGIATGQTLLVRGATSSVGLAAVTYAKARGLTVIGTTRSEEKRERLLQVGVDHVVIDDGTISDQVRAIIPAGVDGALEVVGATTVRDTLKTLRPWGQVVVIGLLGGSPIIESFNVIADLPNTVRMSFFASSHLGSPELPLDESPLNWVAAQVALGAVPDTVARVFPVEEIQEAHRLLDSNRANGKIVVTF